MTYDDNLCAVMDESDAPLTEEEFGRTIDDDIVLLELMKKDGIEPDKDSRLYQVGKELGMF